MRKYPLAWCLTLLFLLPAGMAVAADFVGGEKCRTCHQKEYQSWQGSHHALAMQPANSKTVLGNFDNAKLTHHGVTSTFYIKNNRYMVRTDGVNDKLQEFEIRYTFGVQPLQQYLIEFPGGRMQVLSLAWDTRPQSQGGQRWFHLYPQEKITHDDVLHWTRPSQNWNSMCAECHSTNLEKNYNREKKTFSTSWTNVNVSCESCHGPGSNHVAWANKQSGSEKYATDEGLMLRLDERHNVQWPINETTGNAMRSVPRKTDREIQMCARCHSRRSPITGEYVFGEPLLDHYLPSLLIDGMYYDDGQIDDEVYVYGSFLQSRMYHAGVTCSDCHEPHSMVLRAPGNGVCLQCHQATKYDQATHHFHKSDSQGAACAECHMPTKTYMVVDPRHDHSMRIPRPDLSVTLGTPNACNHCHTDRDAKWSANQVKKWYGTKAPKGYQTYATAFHAAREHRPGAATALAALIRDASVSGIARATALTELAPRLSVATIDVLPMALSDNDPMVRNAAVGALQYTPLEVRVRMAFPMLDDPVRAVRIEAARILISIPAGELSTEQKNLLDRATEEFVAAQLANAERPESQTNLGNMYAARGHVTEAIKAYRTALDLNAKYVPGYVNLADFHRRQGQEADAEKVLRQGLKELPDNDVLHHALGLSLVRQQRLPDAVKELRHAFSLRPENARYAYIYGVALHSAGKQQQAIKILEQANIKSPDDRDILNALISYHRDSGNEKAASMYVDRLRALTR